jgi:rare lipoprotein A
MLGLLLIVAGCSSSPPRQGMYKLGQPYQIQGRWYYPNYDPGYDRTGVASWYGEPFHGRPTANGELFDRRVVTAAHPTLPLPSLVRVTNLDNGRELLVRVNDRGPFVGDRVIDLSQEAARRLGFERQGTTPVRVRFVGLADARGNPPRPTFESDRSPVREPSLQAPQLVAAQPTTQVIAPRAAPCQGQFVQVGAFAEPARVQQVVARLNALEVLAVHVSAQTEDRLARVRLGPIPDPLTASAALDRLKQSGFPEAFIVAPEKDRLTYCQPSEES